MSSWAAALQKPPGPEQRMKALADYYKTLTPSRILSEALGYYNPMLLGTPLEARPLVEHTIVICVDTESYTMNTDQMTELGLVYISRKTAKGVQPPGAHGWKLQEALRFMHFRVVEHAHLKSNRVDSKGPLGNRFGNTTFASFAELRLILNELLNQDIETENPDLKGCKRPVVLVGHALRHDTENTNKQGLEYNLDANPSTVAKVDTQALAREKKVWIPPVGMETNEIGLRVMIKNLGFQHLDDHTACNDAARTMMCAIHMVLPGNLRNSKSPSMQAVADRVEDKSKANSGAPYGTEKCCMRCAARTHYTEECSANVRCAACDRYVVGPNREAIATGHIETYCVRVANFKAWLRRYRDAKLKNRSPTSEIAAGPGTDAHPWSTWPRSSACAYPFNALSDALVGLDLVKHNAQYQEPAPFVHNMHAALGDIPVPSTGIWVPLSSDNSATNATTVASSVALPTPSGMSMGTLSSALPAVPINGASVSAAASSPLHALKNSAAASTTREITMSLSRGRARGECSRGSTRGGLGRAGSRSELGDGGEGETGADNKLSWNPANVW